MSHALKNIGLLKIFHLFRVNFFFFQPGVILIIFYTIVLSSSFAGNIPTEETNNQNKTIEPKHKYNLSFFYTEEKIFITIEFNEKTEKRSHKTWCWDPISQSYREGEDIESSLVLIIREESISTDYFADVWIWRSFISDPAQIAEDYNAMIVKNSIRELKHDNGELCWQTVYYDEFVGEKIPRFKHKKPSGSYADVSAKSYWENGKWRVSLSRARITGHDDDINFEWGKKYILSLIQKEDGQINLAENFIIDLTTINLQKEINQ